MSSNGTDIVVIGAGVVGLSLAWRLGQSGAKVVVLERGPLYGRSGSVAPRGQASWASAGMLAPLAETSSNSPLLHLGAASLKLYPAFMEELTAASGMKVALQQPGILRLALDEEDGPDLFQHFDWQQSLGFPLEWVEASRVKQIEPELGEGVGPGLLSPLEKFVGPRQLLKALLKANEAVGNQMRDHCPAMGFEAKSGQVTGVKTPKELIHCDQVVMAAGSWNKEVASYLNVNVPVRPVRGQIVALHTRPVLSHTIYTHDGYLVPWENGRLLVGSTQDEAGFNPIATAGAVQKLMAFAIHTVPALAEARVDTVWAGLRPGSPDNLPILGLAPGWNNAHLAAGHFRNGVLLAPISALIMSRWVLHRRLDPLFEGVEPERFAQ